MDTHCEPTSRDVEEHVLLRKVLLDAQDQLSDQARKRLHFLLAPGVSRSIQDDTSIMGTLNLIQCLFDQNKINQNDITLVIKAFAHIGRQDIAKQLYEHMKKTRSRQVVNQPAPNLMPVGSPIVDKPMKDLQTDVLEYKRLIDETDTNETNINNTQKELTNDAKRKCPSQEIKDQKGFYWLSKAKKYPLVFILISMILLTIAIVECIGIIYLSIEYNHIRHEQINNTKTIQNLRSITFSDANAACKNSCVDFLSSSIGMCVCQ